MSRRVSMPGSLCLAALTLVACQQTVEAPPPPQQVESAADRAARVAETNMAVFNRFMDEVATKGQLDMINEILSPDFVEHQEAPPGTPPGRDGLTQFITNIRAAFPDLTVTASEMVASGDMVAARSTWTGTQSGEWMGMKPTNQTVTFESIDIVRFADGKAVEHWGLDNSAEMMKRLGEAGTK